MGKTYAYNRNRYSEPDRVNRRKLAPKMKRNFVVTDMTEKHHEIARRLVLGQSTKVIAEDLDISTATVRNVKGSPVVQEQISMLRGARDKTTLDVAEQIKEMAPVCLSVLREQLDSEDVSAHLKSKNAFGLLSIAGHAPVRNINVRKIAAVLTGADIERIRDKSIQAGQRTGVVVDD